MQRGRTLIRTYLLVALSVSASAGFLAHRVYAVDGLELSIESAQGAQWRANGMTTEVDLRGHTQRVVVRIEELQTNALVAPLRDISIDCNEVQLQGGRVRCDAAQIEAVIPGLGAQRFSAAFSYDRANDSVSVQARDLTIGGGRMSAQLSLLSDEWKVNVELNNFGAPICPDCTISTAFMFAFSKCRR